MNLIFESLIGIVNIIYKLFNQDRIFQRLQSFMYYLEEEINQFRDALSEIKLDNMILKQEMKQLGRRVDRIEETVGIATRIRRSRNRG